MGQDEDINNLFCSVCGVGPLEPHQDLAMYKKGWYKCRTCGFCRVIEKEQFENRIKNQK